MPAAKRGGVLAHEHDEHPRDRVGLHEAAVEEVDHPQRHRSEQRERVEVAQHDPVHGGVAEECDACDHGPDAVAQMVSRDQVDGDHRRQAPHELHDDERRRAWGERVDRYQRGEDRVEVGGRMDAALDEGAREEVAPHGVEEDVVVDRQVERAGVEGPVPKEREPTEVKRGQPGRDEQHRDGPPRPPEHAHHRRRNRGPPRHRGGDQRRAAQHEDRPLQAQPALGVVKQRHEQRRQHEQPQPRHRRRRTTRAGEPPDHPPDDHHRDAETEDRRAQRRRRRRIILGKPGHVGTRQAVDSPPRRRRHDDRPCDPTPAGDQRPPPPRALNQPHPRCSRRRRR